MEIEKPVGEKSIKRSEAATTVKTFLREIHEIEDDSTTQEAVTQALT